MANANRGEVEIEVDGKKYVLRFSANALCDLEDALGMSILQITSMISDPAQIRMKMVRALLWAGLREKHPDLTILQAGDIVQELSLSGAFSVIEDAFKKAFPETSQNPQVLDDPKPDGTGPASTKDGSS